MTSADNNLPARLATPGAGSDPIEAAVIDGTLTWRKAFILMAIRTPRVFIVLLLIIAFLFTLWFAPDKLAAAHSMLGPLLRGIR